MRVVRANGESEAAPLIGCYSSGWIWDAQRDLDWVKNILPFFDSLSLFVPDRLFSELVDEDPVLAQPLVTQGLLANMSPETTLDPVSSRLLTETIRLGAAARRERFGTPTWPTALGEEFAANFSGSDRIYKTLVPQHFGIVPSEVEGLFDELELRGLIQDRSQDYRPAHARRSDGDVEPFASTVMVERGLWQQVLLVASHVMCVVRRAHGEQVYPVRAPRSRYASPEWEAGGDVGFLGDVVAHDIDFVGVDLSKFALDEVLDFRTAHGAQYRAYVAKLRAVAGEVDRAVNEREQAEVFARHRDEIRDWASDLRDRTRRVGPRRGVGVGLTAAGAVWSAVSGNPVPAIIASLAAVAGLLPDGETTSCYSYLFHVADAQR